MNNPNANRLSPQPVPVPVSSTVERAAEIRKQLKAKGWTSRQVSVKSDLYSMGSTIRVVIKDAGVPLSVVEAIADAHERIDRDQYGEILSGGNRFVDVKYSSEALAPLAAEILSLLPYNNSIAVVKGFKVFRCDDAWHASPNEELNGLHVLRCYDKASLARQMAVKLCSG